LPLFGSDP